MSDMYATYLLFIVRVSRMCSNSAGENVQISIIGVTDRRPRPNRRPLSGSYIVFTWPMCTRRSALVTKVAIAPRSVIYSIRPPRARRFTNEWVRLMYRNELSMTHGLLVNCPD